MGYVTQLCVTLHKRYLGRHATLLFTNRGEALSETSNTRTKNTQNNPAFTGGDTGVVVVVIRQDLKWRTIFTVCFCPGYMEIKLKPFLWKMIFMNTEAEFCGIFMSKCFVFLSVVCNSCLIVN